METIAILLLSLSAFSSTYVISRMIENRNDKAMLRGYFKLGTGWITTFIMCLAYLVK